jgi:hypothetical protein
VNRRSVTPIAAQDQNRPHTRTMQCSLQVIAWERETAKLL